MNTNFKHRSCSSFYRDAAVKLVIGVYKSSFYESRNRCMDVFWLVHHTKEMVIREDYFHNTLAIIYYMDKLKRIPTDKAHLQ